MKLFHRAKLLITSGGVVLGTVGALTAAAPPAHAWTVSGYGFWAPPPNITLSSPSGFSCPTLTVSGSGFFANDHQGIVVTLYETDNPPPYGAEFPVKYAEPWWGPSPLSSQSLGSSSDNGTPPALSPSVTFGVPATIGFMYYQAQAQENGRTDGWSNIVECANASIRQRSHTVNRTVPLSRNMLP
jgi:hypothetical protein